MCICGRGLGKEEEEAKKAKLFGEEGSNKYIKKSLFPFNTVNNKTAVMIPRDVKTSKLTNHTACNRLQKPPQKATLVISWVQASPTFQWIPLSTAKNLKFHINHLKR